VEGKGFSFDSVQVILPENGQKYPAYLKKKGLFSNGACGGILQKE
jgi:hypothetical protein